MSESHMLDHGGRLRRAAHSYGIPLQEWMDLSTGINPHGWPVPPPPATTWARLPEPDDGLEDAARDYYGAHSLLPIPGSQAAIQALPKLFRHSRVAILSPAYAEHDHAWRLADHQVGAVSASDIERTLDDIDILVLINPNNPTGHRFDKTTLLDWHARLAARGGSLIVDEAFMDATPEESLADCTPRPGLIVLRSLGKFFGLAGVRAGFVLAETGLLDKLNALLGPWSVPGPSRYVATQALDDRSWQVSMRRQLAGEERRLAALLSTYGLTSSGTSLFQWTRTPHAARIHDQLARRGILTRLFKEPSSLRLGLPADDGQWERLEKVLSDITVRLDGNDAHAPETAQP